MVFNTHPPAISCMSCSIMALTYIEKVGWPAWRHACATSTYLHNAVNYGRTATQQSTGDAHGAYHCLALPPFWQPRASQNAPHLTVRLHTDLQQLPSSVVGQHQHCHCGDTRGSMHPWQPLPREQASHSLSSHTMTTMDMACT